MAEQDIVLDDPTHQGKGAKIKEILQKIKDKIAPLLKKIPFDNIPIRSFSEIKQNKKALALAISGALAVITFIIALVLWAVSGDAEEELDPAALAAAQAAAKPKVYVPKPRPIAQLSQRLDVKNTMVGDMIQKANILYDHGQKQQAYDLFEHISVYSQSLAGYNLGVIQLKEGQYENAIKSFDKTIESGEDVSAAALNAAYASFKLGNDAQAYEYLDIGYLNLSSSSQQPVYSYLYSLMNIYKGFYFESFSSLSNPNSDAYQIQNNRLIAQLYTLFNDDLNAINALKRTPSKDDNFAIALLHARLGEYAKARQYIYEFLSYHPRDPKALMALQLIEIKLGNYKESASILNRMMNIDENNPNLGLYPIRVKLKNELFDVTAAQQNFWVRRFEHEKMLSYKILFYYAPIRIVDASSAFESIGQSDIDLNSRNVELAKTRLQEGGSLAKINQNIVEALRDLDSNNLRYAKRHLIESLKIHPNHAILHYNLGVLYAQTGDFDNAYTHFLRAYHLDASDLMSGLFAVISGRLTYRNVDRLIGSITTDFAEMDFQSDEQRNFMLHLIRYVNNALINDFSWINHKTAKPIYYALQSAHAISRQDPQAALDGFEHLRDMYPRDVVSNIMYELTRFYKQDLKEVALELNDVYSKNLDMNSIYYGPAFARELYIYTSFITGSLSVIEPQLEKHLLKNGRDNTGVLQTLGLLNIYNNNFEKAFAYYNALIDDLKEDDSQTRFLASVAALGAGRHENAVALLQISKLESATNMESRFALGLLYQENRNYRAARDHYDQLSSMDFRSEYFDFDLDNSQYVQE